MENKLDAKIEVSHLKQMFSAIKPINNECRIQTTPTGLVCRVVDCPNISMVCVRVPDEWFEEYENKDKSFCVDVNGMYKVLNAFNVNDVVMMVCNDENLTLSSKSCRGVVNLYPDNEVTRSPKEPEVELNGVINISGKELWNIVNRISKISERILFGVDTKDEFYIASKESSNYLRFAPQDIPIKGGVGPFRSLFDINYIRPIAKVLQNATDVIIKMDEQKPIEFIVGNVMYLVAPRIESD